MIKNIDQKAISSNKYLKHSRYMLTSEADYWLNNQTFANVNFPDSNALSKSGVFFCDSVKKTLDEKSRHLDLINV